MSLLALAVPAAIRSLNKQVAVTKINSLLGTLTTFPLSRRAPLPSLFPPRPAPWGALIGGVSRTVHVGPRIALAPIRTTRASPWQIATATAFARTAVKETPRLPLITSAFRSSLIIQSQRILPGRHWGQLERQRLSPRWFHWSGASRAGAGAPTPLSRARERVTMGLGASLLTYFAIDLGIQVAGWAYSYWQQTDKFYDLTGSLTYLTLAGLSLSRSAASPHQLLLSSMVALWAARLGSFLFARVLHAGKDDRLDRVKSQPGTFLLYWTVQAVWVFVVSLPMLLLNASPAAPLSPVAYLGAGIWAAGFAVEAVADHQKDRFRRDPNNKGKWIDSGLWRYSRHPNYFGEITLWTGAALCAASALPALPAAACFLSPLLSYHLTINVSGLPMVEKNAHKRWGGDPAYQAYLRDTSAVIPWPRKPNGS